MPFFLLFIVELFQVIDTHKQPGDKAGRSARSGSEVQGSEIWGGGLGRTGRWEGVGLEAEGCDDVEDKPRLLFFWNPGLLGFSQGEAPSSH